MISQWEKPYMATGGGMVYWKNWIRLRDAKKHTIKAFWWFKGDLISQRIPKFYLCDESNPINPQCGKISANFYKSPPHPPHPQFNPQKWWKFRYTSWLTKKMHLNRPAWCAGQWAPLPNSGEWLLEVIRQYDSCNTGELDRHAQHQQPCLASRILRVIVRQKQPVLSGTHWSSFAHRQISVVLCLRRFPMKIENCHIRHQKLPKVHQRPPRKQHLYSP